MKKWLKHSGITALTTLPLLAAITYGVGVRVNLTNSLPGLLYWQAGTPELIQHETVFACPKVDSGTVQAKERGYLLSGIACPFGTASLIKKIAALPGDHLITDEHGLIVNGWRFQNSKPLPQDGKGRPMQPATFNGIVPDGYTWLVSTHSAKSYDSRYFGLVPLSNIKAKAKRLF